jgi:hypothetical protein
MNQGMVLPVPVGANPALQTLSPQPAKTPGGETDVQKKGKEGKVETRPNWRKPRKPQVQIGG